MGTGKGVITGGSNWGTRRSLMHATASLSSGGGGGGGGRAYIVSNKVSQTLPSNNWNRGTPLFLFFSSRSDFDFLIFLLFFSLLLYFFGFHSILVFDTIFCSVIIAASISNHLHQSYRIF